MKSKYTLKRRLLGWCKEAYFMSNAKYVLLTACYIMVLSIDVSGYLIWWKDRIHHYSLVITITCNRWNYFIRTLLSFSKSRYKFVFFFFSKIRPTYLHTYLVRREPPSQHTCKRRSSNSRSSSSKAVKGEEGAKKASLGRHTLSLLLCGGRANHLATLYKVDLARPYVRTAGPVAAGCGTTSSSGPPSKQGSFESGEQCSLLLTLLYSSYAM